jgi:hypothetical protein
MRSRILRSIAPLGIIPCSTINSRYGAFLNSSSLSRLNSAARSISSRSSSFGDFLDASNHANLAALATLQQSTTQVPLDCTCNCARFWPAVASDGHQHRERPARPAGQQPTQPPAPPATKRHLPREPAPAATRHHLQQQLSPRSIPQSPAHCLPPNNAVAPSSRVVWSSSR